MTPEQQKILDKLWIAWDEQERKKRGLIEALALNERQTLIAEAKFKGVLEAFAPGKDFKWDGKHVRISVKIPGESK